MIKDLLINYLKLFQPFYNHFQSPLDLSLSNPLLPHELLLPGLCVPGGGDEDVGGTAVHHHHHHPGDEEYAQQPGHSLAGAPSSQSSLVELD